MNDQKLTAVEYLLQQINSNKAFSVDEWDSVCQLALAMERSQLTQAEIKAIDDLYKIKRK
jgi:hypothetical protein